MVSIIARSCSKSDKEGVQEMKIIISSVSNENKKNCYIIWLGKPLFCSTSINWKIEQLLLIINYHVDVQTINREVQQ